jgi:hypothetical protein
VVADKQDTLTGCEDANVRGAHGKSGDKGKGHPHP